MIKNSTVAQWAVRVLKGYVMPNAWKSPDGALTGLYLASEHVIKKNIQGEYFHPQAQRMVNPLSLDEQLQDNLWEFSDQLVRDFLEPITRPTMEEEDTVSPETENQATVQ